MDYFVHLYKYAVKIQISLHVKNELTTDQKHKLLLNTCGILFYCRNGAKSTALKRIQMYRVHCCVFFLFCLILFLTSQSTIFRLCRDGSSWVEPVLSYD